MLIRTIAAVAAGLAVVSAVQAAEPVEGEVVASGLSFPLEMVQSPVDPSVQYIVQQTGQIRVINDGALQSGNFMDISGRVSTNASERGLLGLAFDPDFANNGRFYVNYTNNFGDTNVSRFTILNGDPLVGDPDSEEILLNIDQPFANHNGGNINIGPDDMLYIAVGDGGLAGDPQGNGQNKNTLLGSILRIDVSPATGYDVPPDNPFVGTTGADEIWAYGVRNPWKFRFDTGQCGTNGILIADVGQDAWEEVNYAPMDAAGLNYGWDCREGPASFSGCQPPAGESFTDPFFSYPHFGVDSLGGSITGGPIYRGAEMFHNRGRYFFADFVSARIFSVELDINEATGDVTASDMREHTADLNAAAGFIVPSSFGRDADGELYVLDYGSNGQVVRIKGTTKVGDLNQSETVDSMDLGILISRWGDDTCPPADLNNDGTVDSSDLGALIGNWGQ